MGKTFDQKGFSLIVAVVMLLIFAILAAMLTSLVTTDSDIAMYQARSGEALYIANAGQQYLMKQNYPLARVTPQINIVGSSGFIIDPPGALSADINSTVTTIPAVCLDKGVTVDCNTIFPSSGRILIESELIDYTGVGASSFTGATRGRGNSLATSHSTNKGIYHATTLTASVTNSATTMPVSSTTGFIIPGTIKIDQEFLYCEGTVGGFSSCTRGTQGSQAMAHNSGATAIQITATVTGTVPTGIIGDAKRVLRAQAGKYLDGWGVGGAVPITDDLNSVFCASSTDCWAIGAGGTIIHYDGISWASMTSPTTLDLNEVHCVSATDCWAVGRRSNATSAGWTFLRWTGSWGQFSVNTGLNAQHLNSVYMLDTNSDGTADDGWAVGNRRGCINPGPTLLRWGGASWACPSGLPATANENLNSVYMLDNDNGWAVGDAETILRWNGSAWSEVSPGLTGEDLNGVTCVSDTECWAVGTAETILHFFNGSWLDSSPGLTGEDLNGITCADASNCWAVGNPGGAANERPLILNWNGTSWTRLNSNLNINEALNGIHCPGSNPNDCWTVGTTGTILHWNGTAWSAPLPPPPVLLRWNGINWDRVSVPVGLAQSLNSISMLDTDLNGFSEDGWAVGDRIANTTTGWTFLRWNSPTAGTWNQITVTTAANAQNLQSVYMLSATDGWAVGNRIANTTTGWTFLRWNSPTAGTWNQITVTTAANAQNLNSVSMVSGSDGWAVGNRIGAGNNQWTFLRWTGSWSQFSVTTGIGAQNLNSIFMVSSSDGWAVGNRRGCANPGLTILRWNGASWACPAGLPVVDQNLNSIFMVSSSDGWAVGNRRGCANPGLTILRWNGASWACPAGLPVVDQNLNSVYCNSSTDCWAKGNTGIILHWDGTSWSQYPSPAANALNEVFMVRPQNFLRLADWQEVY